MINQSRSVGHKAKWSDNTDTVHIGDVMFFMLILIFSTLTSEDQKSSLLNQAFNPYSDDWTALD